MARGFSKLLAKLLVWCLLRSGSADLNFDRFTHDPKGEFSHLRLIGGSSVDFYSVEFAENCNPHLGTQSLTSFDRAYYMAPPCRGDEVEVHARDRPGVLRYVICAPGNCSKNSDCPHSPYPWTHPRCSYLQESTGLFYCELECGSDSECQSGPEGDAMRCWRGRCMAPAGNIDSRPPRSLTQRFQYAQHRNDPTYNELPTHIYLEKNHVDNPYAGRVQEGKYTEVWVTKEFIKDGELETFPHNRTQLCHYALRLTPPERALNTATWSKFKQVIVYGFVTEFNFRVLHRSKECFDARSMARYWCQEAGGDGFAFVIQNENRKIVGTEVGGIGYAFGQSFVVEFDMYRDLEHGDPDNNHISVMIPWDSDVTNSANHKLSEVVASSDIPPLQEGTHNVRIEYDTQDYKWEDLGRDFTARLDASYVKKHSTGRPGLLSIWLDGVQIMVFPIDLINVVQPDTTVTMRPNTPKQPNETAFDELGAGPGKAWVGFTSSTNYEQYQAVDILSWKFEEKVNCPHHNEGRHAYCDIPWDPPNPDPPRSVETYSTKPRNRDKPCFYDGSELCYLELQNAARVPISLSVKTIFDTPDGYSDCRDGTLQWDQMHPHFLGCSRQVYFTYATKELWITAVDGSRSLIVNDNAILQKAPATFRRRNHNDAEIPWRWCVREHKYDPELFYFAECNCAYCVRLLDISASYSIFYQHTCSSRFGFLCPCFEASESQHDSSAWQHQEPLQHMRLHTCRGCSYNSHCAKALKVAVCEEPYQAYQLGNPLAPTIFNAGFKDRLLDNGRVVDGKLRGQSCNCEPDIRPYYGSQRAGQCVESDDMALNSGNVPTLSYCAKMCSDTARCLFFTYWQNAGKFTGLCVVFGVCEWVACTDKEPQDVDRCFKSTTYEMAALGSYLDIRSLVQKFSVFPRRALQTNFAQCKQCLNLYDQEYCFSQCGQTKGVPYLHHPGGQMCATCMFAGNRFHEMTSGETQIIKDCVYEAVRASEDPWTACNQTVQAITGGVISKDLFNGVSTHYLSECPGRPFEEHGSVCVPNLVAKLSFPLQVLSRMAAINDTVWDGSLECLNAMCQVVSKHSCYQKLAIFEFTDDLNDLTDFIMGIRYGLPKPQLAGGAVVFTTEFEGFGKTRQYVATSLLPWLLENFTMEAWLKTSGSYHIRDAALGKTVEASAPWYQDYLPRFASDGNMKSYWSSQLGEIGNMTLHAKWTCDIGYPRYAGQMKIYWKEPAADFTIAVKIHETDEWETIITVKGNRDETTNHYAFFQAQYIEVRITKAATVRTGLVTVTDFLNKVAPSRHPVVSIREFEVLKDNEISRLKPTRVANQWHRPAPFAHDGSMSSYWATPPGVEKADLLIDFNRTLTIMVLNIYFHVKPALFNVYRSPMSCETCPWVETTMNDNLMQCEDGMYIDIKDPHYGQWFGCSLPNDHRGGKAKCPPNYPHMCQGFCDTSGFDDWCCATDCSPYGGLRECKIEDAKPTGRAILKGTGDEVQDVMELKRTFFIRCLRISIDQTGEAFGERMVGIKEIEAFTEGDNVAPAVFGTSVVLVVPSGPSAVMEAMAGLDGNPDTNWLVKPSEDEGVVVLIVDLGAIKPLMSIEIIFATVDGTKYKTNQYAILVGKTLERTKDIDRVVGNMKMRKKVMLSYTYARFIKLEVYSLYASNPEGMFGLQDLVVYAASENLAKSPVVASRATEEWVEENTAKWTYEEGAVYHHGPAKALDDDFNTWWGAPLGVSQNPNEGAGPAIYEIILEYAQSLSLAAIRWRFRAFGVQVSCAAALTSRYLAVGAAMGITDYITPIPFLGTRLCQKILIEFTESVDKYGEEGIIGIREVELYNVALDHAFRRPAIDNLGGTGNLAVDPDTVSRWRSDADTPKNLTVDLGEPKFAWGIRMLFPSTAIPRGFKIAVANSSDDIMDWADDTNYTVVYSLGDNMVSDLYVITRIIARYVRVMFLSTTFNQYSSRMLQVFGGPNFAFLQTPLAVKSWNHSAMEATDGVADSFWVAEPFATASRIEIDLEEEYFIAGGIEINWKFAPADFTVVASTDGMNWEEVYAVTGNSENITQISGCFTCRYVEVRMMRPQRLNTDGVYAVYSVAVRFDPNLAHCKNITVTTHTNSSQFREFAAIDGDERTIWMPQQGVENATYEWDFYQDMWVSGFEIKWRFPPIRYWVEYQDCENTSIWHFVNQWDPDPRRPENTALSLHQTWSWGFAARRLRINIVDIKQHDEGRIVAIRESILHYPGGGNVLRRRNITATSSIGEHVASYAVDGNERGTYWKSMADTATLVVKLDHLPTIDGQAPPGHLIGRIQIMWRFEPGYFKVELFYDTSWFQVHEARGVNNDLLRTDFALRFRATSLRLVAIAKDPLKPELGILQLMAFGCKSKLVPGYTPQGIHWSASNANLMVDTEHEFSLDSHTETYWMSPHASDDVYVVLDLSQIYYAVDLAIYFGFKAEVVVCTYSVEENGPWTIARLTGGDLSGYMSLESVGPSFPIRYLQIRILKGFRDGEQLLGTSIRDVAVYLFRNWARGATATADSIWAYNPNDAVDGSNKTRWVSRFNTYEAELVIDLLEPTNIAGLNWEFEWGCGIYHLWYTINQSAGWTLARKGAGTFNGLVELPSSLHFKARYLKLSMESPLVQVFHPDKLGRPKTERPVFSVLDFQAKTHPGGGGVFGIQSDDGMQFTTLAYGLRQPGEWILASENSVFTQDLAEPPDFDFDTWNHWAISFATTASHGLVRDTEVNVYKNGMPFGKPMTIQQPIDRISLPNKTRLVFGIRSTAHDVLDADAWPPMRSGLHKSFKENENAEVWPDLLDPVMHGSSHSPYFDGSIRRASLIKNALSPEEVRGLYLDLELGCHCFDACPTGSNRHHPGVPVPCSGQGICRRSTSGQPLAPGTCQCLPGFGGENCQRHCTAAPSLGCCEANDDCPPGVLCDEASKSCLP